jgi:hypothetical protein
LKEAIAEAGLSPKEARTMINLARVPSGTFVLDLSINEQADVHALPGPLEVEAPSLFLPIASGACPHWPIGEVARIAKSTLWAMSGLMRCSNLC